MKVTAQSVRAACAAAAAAMAEAEAELNAADGHLGDGDTGQTMRRVAATVADAAGKAVEETDLGKLFRRLGMAAASATGSSLGTLVSIGLLDLGKALAGRGEVSEADLAAAIERAEATMLARGRSALGDKTALDALHAVRLAMEQTGTAPESLRVAAEQALEDFRDRECRIGRARMYSEKSRGRDDPGMLAMLRLVQGLTAS